MNSGCVWRIGGAFAAAVALSAPTPAASAEAAARQKLACAFGEKLVRNLTPTTLLSDRLVTPMQTFSVVKDAELVDAWRRRGPTNLFVACPELKKKLPAGVRFATEDDNAEVRRLPPQRQVFIATFMAPFVSRDEQKLIHSQAYSCPGLCGGGFVQVLSRKGKTWGEPEMIGMVMS